MLIDSDNTLVRWPAWFAANKLQAPRLEMTAAELADHLEIAPSAIEAIPDERRGIKMNLAQRLGVALGAGARYRLALLMQHDVSMAERTAPISIAPIMPMRHRADVRAAVR